MRNIISFILLLFCGSLPAQNNYDLVIVGGNPGGIMAAVAAARTGKTSIILERTNHIGGLPANGLGATDISTKEATTGLFKEFADRIKRHYIQTYGENAIQVEKCHEGLRFEPSVASIVFDEMLAEHKDKIAVLTMRQFDSNPRNLKMQDDKITEISVLNRVNGQTEKYTGKMFLDATYEGDLAAAAGVPFRVGRESKSEFNEPGAGSVYKYWHGSETPYSTFIGDNAIQAYNYRLCLTNVPANRIQIHKPEHYNRQEYASIVEDVWTGRHTQADMEKVTREMMEENRKQIKAGKATCIPGDKWGMSKVTNLVEVPNDKTDANNQHAAFVSTDLPEENWPWPTASWDWRDRFAQRLRQYTEGLLWFAQNDEELPPLFRKAAKEWGYAKDEYMDNGYFPRQVYVREGRRFEGVHFFIAKDAMPVVPGGRPPLFSTSITASHYGFDSHATHKREPGRAHLNGFVGYPTAVYTVPFGVMIPKDVDNLLFPVPVSGSHIGFSTLRMEPCWMAMGQAAGVAASVAIDNGSKIRNVDMERVQDILVKQHATLVYFKDVHYSDRDFPMVQYMALRGYLPGWTAELDKIADENTLDTWRRLSGSSVKLQKGVSRREALYTIYKHINKSLCDFYISDFKAKPDGVTLNTRTIQQAIDSVSAAGGGRLVFTKGRYLTGSLYLKSNVTLHLEEGAVLLGSTKPFDYKKDAYIGRTSLLFALKQENIGITGSGTIDGQGYTTASNIISYVHQGLVDDSLHLNRPDEVNRPHNIYFRECGNVTIKGIKLKDAASWTQGYDQCTNVLVDGIAVDSKCFWNNDGIDIIDCDSVVIRNSFFDAADDAICFKSHEADKMNRNALVENCVARSSASAVKFGTASKGGFRNITIKNIRVYDTYRSVVTFAAVDGGIVENIRVDGIQADNVGNVVYLRIGDRSNSGKPPVMKDIILSNIIARVAATKPDAGYNYEGPVEHLPRNISPASIIGLPEYRIQDITLRNITMVYPGGADPSYARRGLTPGELDGVPEMRKSYPEFSQFKELPAWGLYVRHADNITLDNVRFTAGKEDYRPAIVTDDVNKMIIERTSFDEPGEAKKQQIFTYKTSGLKVKSNE